MDPTQILLFVVVSVLTILLVAVGVQVFFILREAKKALQRANQILEDASFVTGSLTRPVTGLAGFLEGVRGIKDLVDFVAEKIHHERSEYQGQIESGETHQIGELQERGRRFFHKEGKPLTS